MPPWRSGRLGLGESIQLHELGDDYSFEFCRMMQVGTRLPRKRPNSPMLVFFDPAPYHIGIDAVGDRHGRNGCARLLAGSNYIDFEFGAVLSAAWLRGIEHRH